MPKISNTDQKIGVEVNFVNNTVLFTSFGNENKDDIVSEPVPFEAMKSEEICLAICVRNIGWKFSIID